MTTIDFERESRRVVLLLELAGFLSMLVEGHSPAKVKDQARDLLDKITKSL